MLEQLKNSATEYESTNQMMNDFAEEDRLYRSNQNTDINKMQKK
ncbi:MAG: hypothetical protein R2827_11875 [Bdellovibrionales bacterium]